MSEPMRFDLKHFGQISTMEVAKDGEFVLHSDYARLKAEVQRLEKDVWRMKVFKGIDEDSIQTLRAAVKTVPEWAKVLEAIENNARLEAENRELKAEVERLTAELSNISGWGRGLESDLSHARVEISFLKAENARLRASSFVTAVPVEQYERLIKAGDAMALELEPSLKWNPDSDDIRYQVRLWNAAKEGKQP